MYPNEVIEEVRLENDIVSVVSERVMLKQRGNSFVGLCPFHNEKTASFNVRQDKQMFYCFGCGVGGNVFTFIMKIENYDFPEAVKYLADRVNYRLPEKNLSEEACRRAQFKAGIYEIQKVSAKFFYSNLMSEHGLPAQSYLTERALNLNTCKKYGLGYSLKTRDSLYSHLVSKGFEQDLILSSGLVIKKDDGRFQDRFFGRLMFPILDVTKRVIAFGGRIIGQGEPKYLNSSDTLVFNKSSNLYGLNFAKTFKSLVVVEGYMDVISLYQAGFANAVAALGTAFTDNHASLIKKYAEEAVICFDSDEAGIKAALRAIPILLKSGVKIRVLRLPSAKDPDEYIKKFGAKAFAEQLSNAESYAMYQIEEIKKKYDMSKRYQSAAFANEAAAILSQMQNSIERGVYVKEVARISDSKVEDIEEQVKKLVRPENADFQIRRSTVRKNAGNLDEARRAILYFICTDCKLFMKIKNVLEAYELVEAAYIKMFELVESGYKKKDRLVAAELINHFESQDEQNKAALVFAIDIDYETEYIKEKALNEQLRLTKKAYLDYLSETIKKLETTDENINKLQKLALEHKKIDTCSYISLVDG